jgi:serine/threonine protein kinase
MISEPALDRLSAMFQRPDVSGTRYEIVSVLGRGGMGVVYLARDTVLDREVALKIGDAVRAVPSEPINEARILARLEHPGIVPVHDCGQLPDGRLFYAMKRVRGDRLDRWMAEPHPVTARLAVFLRVCDAIAFAHAHGVVHRDLKPENVMVGRFGEVLVLDWGIAELRGAGCDVRGAAGEVRGAEGAGPGATRAIAGTPDYMAPEQARGDAAIDHRADVFALGVMLQSMAEAAPLAAIARKAQSRDAADRYQDVQALAADVGRYLEGRAVEAHRESIVDRLARFARRYRLPILLVLTYLVVRLLLLWLAHV